MINDRIVNLTDKDESIVWEMLVYAAQQRLPLCLGRRSANGAASPTLEDFQKQDYLARYAVNWGRRGDMGFVAET